jgi:hypothetical protein
MPHKNHHSKHPALDVNAGANLSIEKGTANGGVQLGASTQNKTFKIGTECGANVGKLKNGAVPAETIKDNVRTTYSDIPKGNTSYASASAKLGAEYNPHDTGFFAKTSGKLTTYNVRHTDSTPTTFNVNTKETTNGVVNKSNINSIGKEFEAEAGARFAGSISSPNCTAYTYANSDALSLGLSGLYKQGSTPTGSAINQDYKSLGAKVSVGMKNVFGSLEAGAMKLSDNPKMTPYGKLSLTYNFDAAKIKL